MGKPRIFGKAKPAHWRYYFARKFSASRFEIVMRVFFSRFYQREFRARLNNVLVAPRDGNHAIFYEPGEWERFARRVYRGACRDLSAFRKYVRLIKKTQTASLKTAERIARMPLRTMSWSALGRAWKEWDRAHLEHFLKPIWIPFIIEPLLARDAEAVLKRLERRRRTVERETDDLATVFSPDEANAITKERLAMLRLALRIKRKTLSKSAAGSALRRHAGKFGFIPCYDVIDKPWTVEHFRGELNALLRQEREMLGQELRSLTTKFDERRRAFRELFARLHPATAERGTLIMAHEITFIKDERDDFRRRQSAAIRPLYAEIARRARLSFRVPLYLIREEMDEWFRTERLPIPKAALRDRMRGYALVRKHGELVRIFSGKAMRDFLKRENFLEEQSAGEAVRGLIGNRGKASGLARIVRTAHDLRRVRSGDILIAVTTNPDYVPAMRRCKAFVTDEGGMTSHAAIVARELNIPCLVGTKIGTRAFKDGDRVEVDATKGTVKKL